jgi:hypothetical protein
LTNFGNGPAAGRSRTSWRCGHCWFHRHEERIVASYGVNVAVRRVPEHNPGFGSMNEHVPCPEFMSIRTPERRK